MPYVPDTKPDNPSQYSPLTLAFVGDGVYGLYVRTRLTADENVLAGKLHVRAIKYVKAAAQAASFKAIQDQLTQAETAVYKRGRNAKSPTVPKNADLTEYRVATGVEALFGFLYLSGMSERLHQLMEMAFDGVEKTC